MPMTSATSSCVMPRRFRRSARFSASILTTSLSVPSLYSTQRKASTIQTCQKSAFCVRFACAIMPFRSCLLSPSPRDSIICCTFPSADNRSADSCTAADKQQSAPRQKIGVISRLRRLVGAGFDGAAGPLCRYGIGLLDFLCCFGVLVILLATGAIPVLDIALGGPGRRLGRTCFKLAWFFASSLP